MSEPGNTPEPRAPAPGWYHDPHGILRWWDGAGWTEHVQVPETAPPEPVGAPQQPAGAPQADAAVLLAPGFQPTALPETPEPSGPNYLPWIVALGSLVALCVAAVLIVGGLGGDEGSETDAIPSADVEKVQSGLRTAQAAIEAYAVDHGGSYAGATPEALVAIEGTLSGLPITVTGEASGYTLSAPAGDATFTIARDGSGVVAFTCTPPGGGGCDQTGSWGLAT